MNEKVRLEDIGIAVILFVLFAVGLSFLALYIDDTNFGTGNGLWKSVFLSEYIFDRESINYQHLHESSFVSNLLYFPVYGFLIKHTPLWSADLLMVQKMTVINACFAALALGGFYYLMRDLLKDRIAALGATLAQLSCAVFLTLSTISEDIMPAFSCFVMALIFLLKYTRSGHQRSLALAAFFYGLSWLFHWTMAFAPAFAFAWLVFSKNEFNWAITFRKLGLVAGINLGMVFFFSWWFNAPVMRILIPGKGIASGYLGWSLSDLLWSFVGFVQYIIGGFQFNGLEQLKETLFHNEWYYPSFAAGSILFLLLFFFSVIYIIKHRQKATVKIFGGFLAINFLMGQLMNAYEFSTDLQFYIQPMIWLPIAYGVLVKTSLAKINKPVWLSTIVGIVFLILPLQLARHNIAYFRLTDKQGLDTFYQQQIQSIEAQLGPRENYYFVTRGWDEFLNWAFSIWGYEFRAQTISLSNFLEDHPKETIDQASQRMNDTLQVQLEKGRILIAGPEIIDRAETELVDLFSGFQQTEKTKALLKVVRNNFQIDTLIQTKLGVFYQLSSKGESETSIK